MITWRSTGVICHEIVQQGLQIIHEYYSPLFGCITVNVTALLRVYYSNCTYHKMISQLLLSFVWQCIQMYACSVSYIC